MPGLRTFLDRSSPTLISSFDNDRSVAPEHIALLLPSAIDASYHSTPALASLVAIEDQLQNAQAFEALETIRRQLSTRSIAVKFKIKNAKGQGANTKSRTLISQIEGRLRAAQHRYNRARAALSAIRSPGLWQLQLQELHPMDIHGINERLLTRIEEDADRLARVRAGLPADSDDSLLGSRTTGVVFTGEGRRTLSWIWHSVGSQNAGEMDDCKSSSCNSPFAI